MVHDIRLALRSLRHQPSFALLFSLIIALGAGANGAVFAVVNAVVLRPLPYTQPARLVAVAPTSFFSAADAEFVRTRSRSFADVATSSPGWRMSLLGAGEPVQIVAARPSVNLLGMLGVRTVIGRQFHRGDAGAGRRVVILSHALWLTRFGGDPGVVGRTITLDGAQREIVGVVGREAAVIDPDAEAWVPFDDGSSFARARSSLLYARLADGVDPETATREARALFPEMERDLGLRLDPSQAARVVSLTDVIVGDVRSPLLLVAAAVGMLVVLTAANVGTLLLGRQVARRRDAAVRLALGASRFRLARETLVENVVLACGGAALGLGLARVTLSSLTALLPRDMPRLTEVAIDPLVVAVVLAATICAVVAFGVAPVLMTTPMHLQPLLRQGVQTEARGSRATLDALVVAQMALAVVLGLAAALTGRSLWRLQHVNPGFSAESVLTLRLQPAGARYSEPGRTLAYYRGVSERIAALPGVEKVGLINHLPLSGYNWMTSFAADGAPVAPDSASRPRIPWRMVDGAYFDAMGIALRAGRPFRPADDGTAPLVIAINESAARRYFGSAERAVGRVARLGDARGEQQVEIVGVVGDVRYSSIGLAPAPEIYRPLAQTFVTAMTLVVRTAGNPAASGAAVRAAVWSVDPDVAIAGMAPMSAAVRENLGRPRMIATLLLVFAAVGLAIVVCGVYGVVGYTVGRREREIGIRVALGASQRSVRALVVAQGIRYVVVGLSIGVPAALAVGRLMRGLLYEIEPYDPLTLVLLSITIAAATMAATVGPSRRAVRIEASAMIRGE